MNKKTLVILGVVALVIIVLASTVAGTYNSMVTAQAEVENKQSSVETALQRRNDLIPNLVNTVKGYAKHEQEIYTAIADARSKLAGAETIEEMGAADSELSSAVSRLLVVVENYPNLAEDKSFIALQDQLEGTENRIADARKLYNEAATDYNKKIKKIPANIFAKMFGFEKAELFKAESGADDVPEVDF